MLTREILEISNCWWLVEGYEEDIESVMQAMENLDHRGACDEGLHSFAIDDIAEVHLSSSGRISKGKVCDSYLQRLSLDEEELYGEVLLDHRLLHQCSRIRRGDNPRAHQKPRRGRIIRGRCCVWQVFNNRFSGGGIEPPALRVVCDS